MTAEEWQALLADATNEADLRPEEIPGIALYLDQITSLVATRTAQGSPRFADRLLTKTMVNNYSKDGLISPVRGKTYGKEQILQMLFIYILKNTLSMGEIKQLFQGFSQSEGGECAGTEKEYRRFLDARAESRKRSVELTENLIAAHGFDLNRDGDYLAAILSVVALSADLKNIAQAMIAARFPIPESGKEKEIREKKEKKDRRGKEKPVGEPTGEEAVSEEKEG